MLSQINQCAYTPNSESPQNLSAAQLPLIQQKGPYDITLLVGNIVAQYFHYSEHDTYILDITRTRIVFNLSNISSSEQRLEFRANKWVLIKNGSETTLSDTLPISSDIHETLLKIRQAAQRSLPIDTSKNAEIERLREELRRAQESFSKLRGDNATIHDERAREVERLREELRKLQEARSQVELRTEEHVRRLEEENRSLRERIVEIEKVLEKTRQEPSPSTVESPAGSPVRPLPSPASLGQMLARMQESLAEANQDQRKHQISKEARPVVLINLIQLLQKEETLEEAARKASETIGGSPKDLERARRFLIRKRKEIIDGDRNEFENSRRKIKTLTVTGVNQLRVQTEIDFKRFLDKINIQPTEPFEHLNDFLFMAGHLTALKYRLTEIAKLYRKLVSDDKDKGVIESHLRETEQTLLTITRVEESFLELLQKCHV